MKRMGMLSLFALALPLLAQQAVAPKVVVAVDAERGALVRWSMPDPFPAGGFQLARVTRGGAPQVLATIRPGDPANAPRLSPERQKRAQDFLALAKDTTKSREGDAETGTLSMMLATLSDPDLAAFLGLSYEDRNAPRGETVTYVVSRIDAAGKATAFASSAPTAITPARPPDPPDDFRAEAVRGGVALFWSSPAGAVTFEVRRGGAPITPAPILKLTPPGSQSPGTIDPNARVETKNAYTITSIDLFGRRGRESAPIDVFFPDFTALDPPLSIATSSAEGQAVVTWEAKANASRKAWKIVRSTQPNGLGPVVATTAGNERRFIDAAVSGGTTYYYRINAVNRRDEEGEPAVSPALPLVGKPPAAPTGLSADIKTGRVIVTWIPSADVVAGYQVQRSLDTREWALLTSVAGAEPRYIDVLPADATGTLHYRVIAWGRDDTQSPPSALLTVKLPDRNPPAAPIVQSIDGSDGKVTLRFLARGGSGDATRFAVLRSAKQTDPGVVVGTGALAQTTTTFVDADVLAGALYFYRVVAIDAAGNRSEPSDPATAIRAGSPPLPKPAPPNLVFETTPFRRVLIDIVPTTNASVLYGIERRVGEERWEWLQGPLPAGTTRAYDNTPPRAATAAYRLVAISIDGAPGPPSDEVVIALK